MVQAAETLAVFSGMTLAWNLFRGKRDKYADDDGEMTLLPVMKGVGKDMLGGAFSMVPLGSEFWEAADALFSGGKYYGIEAVTPSAISDAVSSIISARNAIADMLGTVAEGKKVGFDEVRLMLDTPLKSVSKAFGLPYENVENLVNAFILHGAQTVPGEYPGRYAWLKWTAGTGSGKAGKYYDLLYQAYNRNPEQYQELRTQMLADGWDEEKLATAMRDRFKAHGMGYAELYDRFAAGDTAGYDALREKLLQTGYFDEDRIKDGMRTQFAKHDKGYDTLYALFQAAGNRKQGGEFTALRDELVRSGFFTEDGINGALRDRLAKDDIGYDNLYDLYQVGNQSAFSRMYSDMKATELFTEKSVREAMEDRMKEAQGVKKAEELEQRFLFPDEQRQYDSVLSEMSRTDIWRQAGRAAKDKTLASLYDLTVENDSGQNLWEKLNAASSAGISEAEYLLYLTALQMVDQPSESGKLGTYNNAEYESAIRMAPGLSTKERDHLWMMTHNSDKNLPGW